MIFCYDDMWVSQMQSLPHREPVPDTCPWSASHAIGTFNCLNQMSYPGPESPINLPGPRF